MRSIHRTGWLQTGLAALLALGVAGAAPAATYITTSDNENNAHTGVADDDMAPNTSPPCVMNDDPKHPVEFNINVTGAAPTKSAYLAVYINDIDWPEEQDEVFLNGHSLGYAVGQDSLNGSTLFIIPDISWVKQGNNLVELRVDKLNVAAYCAPVQWGQLIIDDSLGAGPATIRSLTSSANSYNFGDGAEVNLEVDTGATSQTLRLELSLRDPNGAIVEFDMNTARENWVINGSADEPYSWAFNLPATGTQGIWQVLVAAYDVATNQFQGMQTVSFAVPQNATLTPKVLAITPNNSPVGHATAVTITGGNFVQGSTSCALGSTPLQNVVAVTGNTVTASINPAMTVGLYDVSCTTANGTGTLPQGMTISAAGAPPTVTAITPTTAPAGVATAVTITGTQFMVGATSCAIGSYALAGAVTVNSTTVTGNVPTDAPAGIHAVSCTTAYGTGSKANAITLTAPAAAPTVSSISPALAPAGVATPVAITGSGFIVGSTSCTQGSYPFGNLAVVSGTEITAQVNAAAPEGTYAVSCTTPNGTGTLAGALTLSSAVPTLAPLALALLSGALALAGGLRRRR